MSFKTALFIIYFCLLSIITDAQKGKTNATAKKSVKTVVPKQVSYGDAFTDGLAKNLNTIIKTLSTPDEGFDSKLFQNAVMPIYEPVFATALGLPEPNLNFFKKDRVDWDANGNGIAHWYLIMELMRQYKNNDEEKKQAIIKQYKEALDKIYGKYKNKYEGYELPSGNYIQLENLPGKDSNSVTLNIAFKQTSLPKPQLTAAIVEFFKPAIYSTRVDREFDKVLFRLYYFMDYSRISNEEHIAALQPMYTELANKNLRRAFGFLMSYWSSSIVETLKESLTSYQRETIKKFANEYVEYSKKPGYSYLEGPQKAPEVIAKKPTAVEKKSPCAPGEKEISHSQVIDTKFGVTRTFAFDCEKQLYIVGYIDSKLGRLAFGTITADEYNRSPRSSGWIYICSRCGGSGGMQAASYTYAYTLVWVKTYSTNCSACWGKGFCPGGKCNTYGQ